LPPPPENIPDELDDIVLLDLGIVFDSLGSFPAHHCRNSYQRWACASASPPDLIISLIRIAAIKVNHWSLWSHCCAGLNKPSTWKLKILL